MADHMESSILFTIKKMLGLEVDYDAYDIDVMTHINSALMTLQQLGVGPEQGMFITGPIETWDDFFNPGQMLEAAKSYIYYRVRMVFDPPTNSFVMDSLQKNCDMLEWRLKEQARFFDAEKGKYVRRAPEPVQGEPEAMTEQTTGVTLDGSSEVVDYTELAGSVFREGNIGGQAVHFERDSITPIEDEVGQYSVMKGGC